MKGVLLVDHYSFKKELYGLKGDSLQVMAEYGEVLIVSGAKRVRVDGRKGILQISGQHTYPINKNKVTIST